MVFTAYIGGHQTYSESSFIAELNLGLNSLVAYSFKYNLSALSPKRSLMRSEGSGIGAERSTASLLGDTSREISKHWMDNHHSD